MMTKKRKLSLAFATIALIVAVILYWYQGGFSTPDIAVLESQPVIVNGRYFKGKNTDIVPIIDSLKSRNFRSAAPKDFILYSLSETSDEGDVDVFVGVIVEDSSTSLHKEYGFKYFPPRKVVRGHINGHDAMITKVQEAVFEYISENAITMSYNEICHWTKYAESSVTDLYFDVPVVE